MSVNVPATFQVKFQNNVELVLQQQQSRLMMACDWSDEIGAEKIKVKDLVGNNTPQEADERHGDTKYNNNTHDGVWLPKTNELYDAVLVDDSDNISQSIELTGLYTQAAAGVLQRAYDRRILEGFYGNIISGKDGTTQTAFPAGQIVPVTTGGASGAQRMNIAKLRAANKMLMQGYVDMTLPRYMVLTAEQNDDLLTEVPATSEDFKGAFGGVVEEGVLRRLLGWNFIPLELANPALVTVPTLSVDGSGYRKTPFWVKGGIRGNFWRRARTSIDPVPNKVLAKQVFAGTTLAATRTQAGRCGIILNSEA